MKIRFALILMFAAFVSGFAQERLGLGEVHAEKEERTPYEFKIYDEISEGYYHFNGANDPMLALYLDWKEKVLAGEIDYSNQTNKMSGGCYTGALDQIHMHCVNTYCTPTWQTVSYYQIGIPYNNYIYEIYGRDCNGNKKKLWSGWGNGSGCRWIGLYFFDSTGARHSDYWVYEAGNEIFYGYIPLCN